MNEVLSQDEIDQLLMAISSGDSETEEFKPVNDTADSKSAEGANPPWVRIPPFPPSSDKHPTCLFSFLPCSNLSKEIICNNRAV